MPDNPFSNSVKELYFIKKRKERKKEKNWQSYYWQQLKEKINDFVYDRTTLSEKKSRGMNKNHFKFFFDDLQYYQLLFRICCKSLKPRRMVCTFTMYMISRIDLTVSTGFSGWRLHHGNVFFNSVKLFHVFEFHRF